MIEKLIGTERYILLPLLMTTQERFGIFIKNKGEVLKAFKEFCTAVGV